MDHPRHYAQQTPDAVACCFAGTEQALSYAELESAANRGAHLIRRLGLKRGDVMAAMLDNELAVFTIAWAAERAGIYFTSVSTRLSVADATYIVRDCGAALFVVSDSHAALATDVLAALPGLKVLAVDQGGHGLASWTEACASLADTPIADESPGADMLYSSGTTGRPKGVKPALPTGALGTPTPLVEMGRALYRMGGDTIYLSTSPLYHSAPLRWAMTIHRLGGCVVVMGKFDAETALRLIDAYRVTHGTWVPTHFARLLKLPAEIRARYDLSSMRAAIHAGAPCPVAVKRAMLNWWGPIVEEYYSGTETCGITALSAREWLERPGSVGKAVLGTIRILDETGAELPAGETGTVYFSDGPRFEYHNDPDKTAQAYTPQGWATMGDIGRIDGEGYLYLTDRKNFMIISGGVNIYPQEIENAFMAHPKVADVAVVGEPDNDMGEIAVAVVQLVVGVAGTAELAEDLRQFARAALGGVKTPRRIDFRDELPREPTGKLLKAKLVEEYRHRTPNGKVAPLA